MLDPQFCYYIESWYCIVVRVKALLLGYVGSNPSSMFSVTGVPDSVLPDFLSGLGESHISCLDIASSLQTQVNLGFPLHQPSSKPSHLIKWPRQSSSSQRHFSPLTYLLNPSHSPPPTVSTLVLDTKFLICTCQNAFITCEIRVKSFPCLKPFKWLPFLLE